MQIPKDAVTREMAQSLRALASLSKSTQAPQVSLQLSLQLQEIYYLLAPEYTRHTHILHLHAGIARNTFRAEEVAQLLREFITLAENSSSVSSTHTIYNSSSRESSAFSISSGTRYA